jgi:hypothetical protein
VRSGRGSASLLIDLRRSYHQAFEKHAPGADAIVNPWLTYATDGGGCALDQ